VAVYERLGGVTVSTGAAVTVKLTEIVCGVFVAPDAVTVIRPLGCTPGESPVGDTVTARVPVFVPEAEAAPLIFNQGILETAVQVRVPVPAFVIVTGRLAEVAPFCTAEKESVGGVSPIIGVGAGGGGGVTDDEGGETNCANPGISAANLLIDRPPPLPPPDDEALPAPAAANGMVPVAAVPAAMEPVAVAGNGTALMVARGTAAPMFLLSEEGSLNCEVALSLCKDDGGVGKDLVCEEPAGDGSTDATGAFCGFRISRCGLLVKV
jgi:hypothetical protein